MAVGPHHSHCVVSLFFDSGGVYLRIDFLFLYQHGSTELIDADCALAVHSQGVRVNLFLFSVLIHNNFPFSSVVKHKDLLFILFLDLFDDTVAKICVKLREEVLWGNDECYGSAVVRIS